MDALLNRLRDEIEQSTRDLSAPEWTLAPHGRWNTAQILEHLGRTYGTTAKMLELSIAAGALPQIRAAKLKEVLLKIFVVDMGILPSGAKSPAMVIPADDAGPDALARTLSSLARMDAAFQAADERWGSGKAIAIHPILGPLNSRQWRKFHYLHGHHHVRQIWQRLGREAVTRS
jgi:hypothetical protein